MSGEGKLTWQKTLSQGFASSGGTSSISVPQQMGGKGEQSHCTKEKTTEKRAQTDNYVGVCKESGQRKVEGKLWQLWRCTDLQDSWSLSDFSKCDGQTKKVRGR